MTEPGYPYERLTTEEVTNVQRLRDKEMTTLRHENNQLIADLYYAKQRLNELRQLLKEMGIDEAVVLATAELFTGPDK